MILHECTTSQKIMMLLPLILIVVFHSFTNNNCVMGIKEQSDRVFTADELSKYNGNKDVQGEIYLSVLGEVYNVTSGREFYGIGQGYSFFAGRDATICFFTGQYNVDHITDKKVLDFEGLEIAGMDDWRQFYETHEEYRFLGVLIGDYYDSNGEETPYLLKIKERVITAREEVLEKEKRRKEEQERRKAARLAAEREKQEMAKEAFNEL